MNLIEVNGDLVKMFKQNKFDIIAHGCNTRNIMGAGIAKTIRQAFPKVFQTDAEYSIPLGRQRLGTYSVCQTSHGLILNFYTQENIYRRPNGDIPFEVEALHSCLDKLSKLENLPIKKGNERIKVGFPYIGAGLAGGNQKEVREIFANFAEKYKDLFEVTLVTFP